MSDPYTALGVSPTATQAEITHAYRRHLRDHHPDTRHESNSGADDSDADERLHQILAAYAVLRDPHRRYEYDRAHVANSETSPVQISVTHFDATDEQPPLWAGPVHWQR